MARTNFSPVSEALNSLIGTIAGLHSDILAKANAERREALDLYARMQDTYQDLVDFNAMVAGAAEALAGVDEVATDIGCKVFDVLEEGFEMLPECDYEDFVGFCAGCGDTITDDDDIELVDGEFYHKTCAPIDEDLDEDVAEDGEQITIDDIATNPVATDTATNTLVEA